MKDIWDILEDMTLNELIDFEHRQMGGHPPVPEDDETEAWRDGADAHAQGYSQHDNPFPEGCPNWRRWAKGFDFGAMTCNE